MPPETGDEIVDALLLAGHRVRTATDACLRDQGLSLARLKVLRLLEGGARPMGQLSEALGVAPRSTTDLVDGMVAAGLLVRRAHPSDRRVVLLELTDEGRSQLACGWRRASEVHRRATAGLSAQDRRRLVELLSGIGASCPGDHRGAPAATANRSGEPR